MATNHNGCRSPKMLAKSRFLHLILESHILFFKSEVEHTLSFDFWQFDKKKCLILSNMATINITWSWNPRWPLIFTRFWLQCHLRPSHTKSLTGGRPLMTKIFTDHLRPLATMVTKNIWQSHSFWSATGRTTGCRPKISVTASKS